MILINIKMQIRPEKMDEWLALADSYAKDVNSEDGCLFFQFARSLTDDNEFVCIEGFKDAEAGAAHVKQPYVKKFFDTAPGLVATQPQIIYIDTRMTASARWPRSSLADRPRHTHRDPSPAEAGAGDQ
jgi:quinol monooxygenase YgiN